VKLSNSNLKRFKRKQYALNLTETGTTVIKFLRIATSPLLSDIVSGSRCGRRMLQRIIAGWVSRDWPTKRSAEIDWQ